MTAHVALFFLVTLPAWLGLFFYARSKWRAKCAEAEWWRRHARQWEQHSAGRAKHAERLLADYAERTHELIDLKRRYVALGGEL